MEEGSCFGSAHVSPALRPTTCLLVCSCLHCSFLWFMLLALDLSPYIGIVTCLILVPSPGSRDSEAMEVCTLAAVFPSMAVNCIRSKELMASASDQDSFMVSRFSRGASGWASSL